MSNRNGKLFPEAPTRVRAARAEPAVWIRRLVIWESPGKIVRELVLRRGLNVVWSPDPGPDASDVGAEGGVGHGVGKSLFCRLVRYCLGEDTFAAKELTELVVSALPQGQVGAEVVVGGATWSVIRPIGAGRESLSAALPLDDLASGGPATGMDPLLLALRDGVVGAETQGRMPGARANREWLLALAWMTRDQEAGFSDHLTWRSPSSESRSPAQALGKEDALQVVRLLLGALHPEESDQQSRQAEASAELLRRQKELAEVRDEIGRLERKLIESLGAEDLQLAGPLGASALLDRAKARLAAATQVLDDIDAEAEDPEGAAELATVERNIRDLEENIRALHGDAGTLQRTRARLQTEFNRLDADAIAADNPSGCPLCRVPVDVALAQGCGISRSTWDPEAHECKTADKKADLDACDRAISAHSHQIDTHAQILDGNHARARELRAQKTEKERVARVALRERAAPSEDARRTLRRANRLVQLQSELPAGEENVARAVAAVAECASLVAEQRAASSGALVRWDNLFNYVCHGLLGPKASGELKLTGTTLKARVRKGGTAVKALSAIAFDLSALLMAVEGAARLPGMLIHDSPRAVDLGLSDYHRLFKLAIEFEKLGDAGPAFQYIVTTTTEPPEAVLQTERLVLKLDGGVPDGRLLGREL